MSRCPRCWEQAQTEYEIVPPHGAAGDGDPFDTLTEAVAQCWTDGGEQVWARRVTTWEQVHP